MVSSYIGKKYNKLTVIDFVDDNKYTSSNVLCQCDCGNYSTPELRNVISNHTNGITLCKTCHDMAHQISGCTISELKCKEA